ncbi:MAG: two-component system sensor histidine kinase NtrB [Dichotomicrobium sp.]
MKAQKAAARPSDDAPEQADGPSGRFTDFEALLNTMPHPVLVLGPDNRVLAANFPAEVFFGISENVLRRRAADDLVAFSCPLLALIRQVRQTSATVNEYGVDLTMPDGEKDRVVDVFAAPLIDHDQHIMVMLQQRTMAQMIERQLTHRGAARSVSGLAAVLAHEIKNPLSGIRGAAQLLESGAQPEDRALAQLICDETERIRGLVERMEVFGDERPHKSEPVNIHAVLDHVMRIASSGFARHIRFVQAYDPSLPPVPGNRDKLIQAVLNLVKNAAEAIGTERTDGQITLATAFRPGIRLTLPNSSTRVSLPLEISVSDNGPGVSEDIRAYLFDPFVTTKPKGTGLGLAMVAKIVNDHGGVIECDAEARQTAFRVLMPMHREPRREPQGEED